MSKNVRGETNSSGVRFEAPRRYVDDESPDFSLDAFLQLGGHQVQVPVMVEVGSRVELPESSVHERVEIIPAQSFVLSGAQF